MDIVKYSLLWYYSSGYGFKEEDVRLICAVLREFIDKSLKRIKKVTREDWNEFIYFALDSLWAAALETDVMTHMSVKANEELVEVFRNILTYRVSNSIKEYTLIYFNVPKQNKINLILFTSY